MHTVVELPEFIRRSRPLISEREVQSLISYLAGAPLAGDLIEGTGGIRKLRWAREGMGKRGGVGSSTTSTASALTLFGKNEQADLSMAERATLAKLVERLIAASGI